MVYPEPTNLTSIYGIMEYANSVSEGYYFIMIPIGLYLVIFLYLKLEQYSTPDCMMAAGFLSSIVVILLRLLNALSTYNLIWVLALSVLPAVWAYFSKKDV